MPRLHLSGIDLDDYDADDHCAATPRSRTRPARNAVQTPDRPAAREAAEPRFRPRQRRNERDPFKCGRCRAFIAPAETGSAYRNHCPLCLTSRHVDASRPGDRASPCRALMPAAGTYFRPGGEQMLVHQCNGCGAVRTNRIAADDNPVALRRLALVAPPNAAPAVATDEAIA